MILAVNEQPEGNAQQEPILETKSQQFGKKIAPEKTEKQKEEKLKIKLCFFLMIFQLIFRD